MWTTLSRKNSNLAQPSYPSGHLEKIVEFEIKRESVCVGGGGGVRESSLTRCVRSINRPGRHPCRRS